MGNNINDIIKGENGERQGFGNGEATDTKRRINIRIYITVDIFYRYVQKCFSFFSWLKDCEKY